MSTPVRSRRLIALLASYVVALQALLLPLTVAAFAAPDAGICFSAASDVSHQPAGHDTGCACAAGCGMQCCAAALGAPPRPEIAPRLARVSAVEPPLTPEIMGPHSARSPHSPRAPPFA